MGSNFHFCIPFTTCEPEESSNILSLDRAVVDIEHTVSPLLSVRAVTDIVLSPSAEQIKDESVQAVMTHKELKVLIVDGEFSY